LHIDLWCSIIPEEDDCIYEKEKLRDRASASTPSLCFCFADTRDGQSLEIVSEIRRDKVQAKYAEEK